MKTKLIKKHNPQSFLKQALKRLQAIGLGFKTNQ